MEKEDSDYMAMLNNSTINPGPKQEQTPSLATTSQLNTATPNETLTSAFQAIMNVSNDLVLVSESDEPFEWISADWAQDKLPVTAQEIIQLGWVDPSVDSPSTFKTKTLNQFFDPLVDEKNDPYNQAKGFQKMYKLFKDAFSDAQVYFIGEGSINVFVLGIINATSGGKRALAGLRSLLVQT
ncbi:hypothetical protein BDA99DRAFT_494964 [Phascolomyces articulosus]|uniref:Uncharacterized protein n=1 Tax=Phascolomyces articulosus TaxID=60185 RepID=A0AAD5KPY8_9FUNG|nr:hypothetical protein BDA99DRAFT_494964 [Phascolomyces articulosus]